MQLRLSHRQEEEVQSQKTQSSRHKKGASLDEKEVGVDVSSNMYLVDMPMTYFWEKVIFLLIMSESESLKCLPASSIEFVPMCIDIGLNNHLQQLGFMSRCKANVCQSHAKK